MSIFKDFFVKEKPLFTGITRGIHGFGFGSGSIDDGPLTISGGSVVTSPNGITYHYFTAPGTLDISSGTGSIYYTMVAGGGSGSKGTGGYVPGQSGQPTTAFGLSATGGGGAGGFNNPGSIGKPGGSGGGGNSGLPTPSAGGTGTAGQGFPGGTGGINSGASGGGGGAGGAGTNATPTANGSGGIGKILLDSAPTAYSSSIPTLLGAPGPTPGRWVAGGGGAFSNPVAVTNGVGGAGSTGAGGGGNGTPMPTGGMGFAGGGAGGYISGTLVDQKSTTDGPFAITIGNGGGSPGQLYGAAGIVVIAVFGQV